MLRMFDVYDELDANREGLSLLAPSSQLIINALPQSWPAWLC